MEKEGKGGRSMQKEAVLSVKLCGNITLNDYGEALAIIRLSTEYKCR